MQSKPSVPKGTRDFSPDEMLKRDFIFSTIKSVFHLYGYQPIETPAIENLATLLGKYGEEGDKLLFRVLDSGDFLSKVSEEELIRRDAAKLSSLICEKGLRYDLTVPFARYVVQHKEEITFPFKRYQIQPVWRADRPQKGRYREFFQCDADVIGSNSLLNEYELVKIIDEIFRRLKIPAVIKINNRKVLSGIAEVIGEADHITDITVAIDKIDKIGIDAVNDELKEKGISPGAIAKLQPILSIRGDTLGKLTRLEEILSVSTIGTLGISELKTLFNFFNDNPIGAQMELDITLARGLNYYTGAIIEVKANDVSIGSICGGGRYDNLTGIFGLDGVSGVGVSFGADRIYDVLVHLNAFPDLIGTGTTVMFVNFGGKELDYSLRLLNSLHQEGVNSELYPDTAKMKKQMSYADSKHIPFVAMAGDEEIKNNEVTIKNMMSGEQKKIPAGDLINFLTSVTS
jgi:histidyl-tRNA synthetase